jgi:hypothetical protein
MKKRFYLTLLILAVLLLAIPGAAVKAAKHINRRRPRLDRQLRRGSFTPGQRRGMPFVRLGGTERRRLLGSPSGPA